MIYDLESDIKKVFRCDNETNEILQEWPNLNTWLSNEIERLSLLFDKDGVEYEKDFPTVPQHGSKQ
jgi:signal transduction histidine kinase